MRALELSRDRSEN